MRRKLSGILIGLGVLMILGAAGLLLHNRQESEREASFSARILPVLERRIEAAAETATAPPLVPDPLAPERSMPVAEIDGNEYVGVLEIPSIGYRSTIMADWSYQKLELSACRFHGSVYSDDLVLCAHNYNSLYRKIAALQPGDAVWFTDMDGLTWTYEVSDLETLSPNMVEEMNDSGYELTFFTCTYGGQARLTLRCVRN